MKTLLLALTLTLASTLNAQADFSCRVSRVLNLMSATEDAVNIQISLAGTTATVRSTSDGETQSSIVRGAVIGGREKFGAMPEEVEATIRAFAPEITNPRNLTMGRELPLNIDGNLVTLVFLESADGRQKVTIFILGAGMATGVCR